jgi:hypothetical protein
VSPLSAAVRLDARTVSPYWRQLLPLVGAAGIIAVVSSEPVVVVVAGAVFGSVAASYPFAVSRGVLVAGRYLYAVALYLVIALLTTALAVLGSSIGEPAAGLAAGDLASAAAVGFGVYSLLAGTQLPVYFALGYTRGRMVSFVPLVLGSSAIGMGVSMLGDGMPDLDLWLARWSDRLAPLAVVAGVLLLAASAVVSWRLDRRRAARAVA